MAEWDDTDWFRSFIWSDQIAADFEARLARAREWNRPQYLRIQGLHLVRQQDPFTRTAGKRLLQRVIDDYADEEASEATLALENLAAALSSEQDWAGAAQAWRAVLAVKADPERAWQVGGMDVELSLAEVLLAESTPEALREADDLLDRAEVEAEDHALFRDLGLRVLIARARVAAALHEAARAACYASQALLVAAETTPPLPRHPDVGRPTLDEPTRAELRALVAN